MKRSLRALAALPVLAFGPALLAARPGWALRPHTELLLTPAGAASSVTLLPLDGTHVRITLLARTILTLTPDPRAESTSRQWVLPAGAELEVELLPGQALHRLDLAQSVALEVVSADPASAAPSTRTPSILERQPNSLTGTTPSATLTISPDPGVGEKYPPT